MTRRLAYVVLSYVAGYFFFNDIFEAWNTTHKLFFIGSPVTLPASVVVLVTLWLAKHIHL